MESVDGVVKKTPVYENTWVQGVTEFEHRRTSDGFIILVYTLGNGHQFTIPLKGRLLDLTRRAISPVALPGDSPNNGHGATRI